MIQFMRAIDNPILVPLFPCSLCSSAPLLKSFPRELDRYFPVREHQEINDPFYPEGDNIFLPRDPLSIFGAIISDDMG